MLQLTSILCSKDRCMLCVDAYRAGDLQGRLYHSLLAEPKSIFGAQQLMLQMEDIFEQTTHPVSSTRSRAFRDKTKMPAVYQEEQNGDDMINEISEIKAGEKATFLIKVQYRQNATWQGEVTWVEKKETRQFRSALELIKMIDSAAEQSGI